MATNEQLSQAAVLSGRAKLAAVTALVDELRQDLSAANLPPQQRDAALEELKIYGRDPRDAGPIFAKEGIEMLTRHAFNSSSSTTSRNALRVLCNALFLDSKCRQMFVDLGYEPKACDKLKNDGRDDEFLISRLIFLLTYGTSVNLVDLINKHQLADSICKNLERQAKYYSENASTTDPMQEMSLVETAKLLFNVTHFCEDKRPSFTPAIPHLVSLLCKASFKPAKPLDPPIGPLVNALSNLDLGDKDVQAAFFPEVDPCVLSNRLINLLSDSRSAYDETSLEPTIPPLLGVLRVLHEHAPSGVRTSMRQKLLPTEADRNEVLGRSASLPSWLLKTSTNATSPELRDTISLLLFDLSDQDAGKFVENVGYGFASGFLYNRNIPIPPSADEAFSNEEGRRPINPVTGQFLDSERPIEGPEMTEEEREREAERLFVLFERLRANGVISVENPMRTAVEEGRFEELPDDEEVD
ncbi:guanine nucleotide exchange factor [Xylariaceae sp. FL0255]|nr:guanine nucleotide exchange factor [Xylariaceae sp. FL0255]